jgi:DNA-binding NtrC family response regulator
MKSPRVYLIDRNPRFREMLENRLKSIHCNNITHYDNGESCYINNKYQADLIILDSSFGSDSWSGLEFMEEYRRISPNTDFIFLSSNANINNAVESISKGAGDYIIKSRTGLNRLLSLVARSWTS